jgi:hypothetical protein
VVDARGEMADSVTRGLRLDPTVDQAAGDNSYGPANIGTNNYLSRGLEFSTQLEGLSHLGYVLGDRATCNTYYPWGKAYLKTWNPASMIFLVVQIH